MKEEEKTGEKTGKRKRGKGNHGKGKVRLSGIKTQ